MKPTFWQSIKDNYYGFKQWIFHDATLVEYCVFGANILIILAMIYAW